MSSPYIQMIISALFYLQVRHGSPKTTVTHWSLVTSAFRMKICFANQKNEKRTLPFNPFEQPIPVKLQGLRDGPFRHLKHV